MEIKDIRQVLKAKFGYDTFRLMQEEIILHTVKGGDSLVLMPTGGGKSLCFQMAALMMDGMAVVEELVKAIPNRQAMAFLDWFKYSENTIDGQSQ